MPIQKKSLQISETVHLYMERGMRQKSIISDHRFYKRFVIFENRFHNRLPILQSIVDYQSIKLIVDFQIDCQFFNRLSIFKSIVDFQINSIDCRFVKSIVDRLALMGLCKSWTLDWTVDWTGPWTGLWTGLDCGLDWTMDWTGLTKTAVTKAVKGHVHRPF